MRSYSHNVAVSTLTDWLDRAVMALVDHVPGAAIAALAIGFYPGLGLLLPLAFKWPAAWLVDANVIGVCGAAVLSLGWFAAQVEAAKRRHLAERIDKVRRPQPCPICGQPMQLDRSPHGWWLRCVAAGCRGKRDLGAEPGRAVELLTQPPPPRSKTDPRS